MAFPLGLPGWEALCLLRHSAGVQNAIIHRVAGIVHTRNAHAAPQLAASRSASVFCFSRSLSRWGISFKTQSSAIKAFLSQQPESCSPDTGS